MDDEEKMLRQAALQLAVNWVSYDARPESVVEAAEMFLSFLKGETVFEEAPAAKAA